MSNWSFITHITDYMARPRIGNQKAPTQWPSEASALVTNEHGESGVVGKCRRQAYFRLLLDSFVFSDVFKIYEPLVTELHINMEEIDPYLRWIWKQGELYEDFCVDTAKEAGVFIAGQTQVYVPEINLSGKIDVIVIDPTVGKYHIVEVKSVYGYNANYVLGSPGERKKGMLGKPRDAHLMQIGLYQWWLANKNPDEYSNGYLVYGARDTGRYAEYEITVEEEEGEEFVFYKGNAPNKTEKINSGLSINNILEQYKYVAKCLHSGEIPERDFELRYSEEKIGILCDRGELSKKDSEQYLKRKKQIEENKTRLVKPVEKGDWQCRLCQYRNVCYSEDSKPTNI